MAHIDAVLQALAQQLVHDLTSLLVHAPIDDLLLLSSKGERKPRSAATTSKRPPGRPPGRKKTTETKKASTGRKVSKVSKQGRRSSEEIETLVEQIAAAVRNAEEGADGVPVRLIARTLKVQVADLTRPMVLALQQGKIRKKGDRRNARYFPGK